MKKVNIIFSLLLLVSGILTFGACKKNNPVTNEEFLINQLPVDTPTINKEVYQIMKDWYLWNDGLPEVDLTAYDDPDQLMEALAWHPNDRWSYVGIASTYSSFFDEGQFIGHGYGSTWFEDGILILNFVYKDSPAYEAGLRRGYTIEKIDGVPVLQIPSMRTALGPDEIGHITTFTVKDLEGNVKTMDIPKDLVTMNTVLHTQIDEVAGKKVGYLVFKSFVQPSIDELHNAFSEFKANGVNEVVLDLRYNGGGRVNVADYLMSWLVPLSAKDQPAFVYEHNLDRAEERNRITPFDSIDFSLNLPRVFALTSLGTASASELVINCLKPYMEVIQIGYDTYGKPVGSYGFRSEDEKYVIAPISIRIANANGYGGYFEGLQPDSYTTDNPRVPFGSAEEWGYQQALHYIEFGNFADFGKKQYVPFVPPYPSELRGLRAEMGSF